MWIILDTNVLLYALGSDETDVKIKNSRRLLMSIENGDLNGIIPVPVIVEVSYLLMREYDIEEVRRMIRRMINTSHMTCVPLELEDGFEAGVFCHRSRHEPEYCNAGRIGPSKTLSSVDGMILAIGERIPGSIICSYDKELARARPAAVLDAGEILDRISKGPCSRSIGTVDKRVRSRTAMSNCHHNEAGLVS